MAGGCAFSKLVCGFLDYRNVGSGGAFLALLESGRIDCRKMRKYIRAVFLLDEAEAFVAVKPFYNSVCHGAILLS